MPIASTSCQNGEKENHSQVHVTLFFHHHVTLKTQFHAIQWVPAFFSPLNLLIFKHKLSRVVITRFHNQIQYTFESRVLMWTHSSNKPNVSLSFSLRQYSPLYPHIDHDPTLPHRNGDYSRARTRDRDRPLPVSTKARWGSIPSLVYSTKPRPESDPAAKSDSDPANKLRVFVCCHCLRRRVQLVFLLMSHISKHCG